MVADKLAMLNAAQTPTDGHGHSTSAQHLLQVLSPQDWRRCSPLCVLYAELMRQCLDCGGFATPRGSCNDTKDDVCAKSTEA